MQNKPKQTKQEWKIIRSITVDDQPSELVVKASIDNNKATYRITATITTKQISDYDNETNDQVIKQVAAMLTEATDKALEIRSELLKIQQGTVGMDELPFAENTIQMKKFGDRPPIGQK